MSSTALQLSVEKNTQCTPFFTAKCRHSFAHCIRTHTKIPQTPTPPQCRLRTKINIIYNKKNNMQKMRNTRVNARHELGVRAAHITGAQSTRISGGTRARNSRACHSHRLNEPKMCARERTAARQQAYSCNYSMRRMMLLSRARDVYAYK